MFQSKRKMCPLIRSGFSPLEAMGAMFSSGALLEWLRLLQSLKGGQPVPQASTLGATRRDAADGATGHVVFTGLWHHVMTWELELIILLNSSGGWWTQVPVYTDTQRKQGMEGMVSGSKVWGPKNTCWCQLAWVQSLGPLLVWPCPNYNNTQCLQVMLVSWVWCENSVG